MLTFDVVVLTVELLDSCSQCCGFALSAQLFLLGFLGELCHFLEPHIQLYNSTSRRRFSLFVLQERRRSDLCDLLLDLVSVGSKRRKIFSQHLAVLRGCLDLEVLPLEEFGFPGQVLDVCLFVFDVPLLFFEDGFVSDAVTFDVGDPSGEGHQLLLLSV